MIGKSKTEFDMRLAEFIEQFDTKETQPMSDTLQEREDEMSDDGSKEWCDDCHGYTHMPWCPAYEPAVDDRELYMQPPTNEHQPAARSGGESQLQPGMNLTCLRCFNDGWDAHRRGLHPANFHAGFATQDAPHTCNQHQSLVAERERLETLLNNITTRAKFALSTPGFIRDRDGLQKAVDAIEQRSTSE